MKILIAGLKENIQVKRLAEEGEKRGHTVEGCFAADLILSFNKDQFSATLKDGRDLKDYDLIYMIVGKRRWEWYTAAYYLNKKSGTKTVNFKSIDPNYNYFLTPAIDYLRQIEEGLPFPKSAVLFSEKTIKNVIQDFKFPFILKTSEGRQGKGVYLIHNLEEAVKAAKEVLLTGAMSFVVREFIPNDGDFRIFTVGYKAIGAMKRTPKEGEFRSNISQGGSGAIFDLNAHPEVKEIAEKAARVTRTEIAGVDIILNKETGEPYILEINPGPQFEGLEKYTKVNAALEIIKYFESLYNEPQ